MRELRGQVLDGTLAGTHLREVELSERLGVSRQSLRAALAELTFRGLLHREPHRGVYVPRLTRADVRDIYDMRRIIEGEAVRRVALDPARLSGIEAAVAALELLERVLERRGRGRRGHPPGRRGSGRQLSPGARRGPVHGRDAAHGGPAQHYMRPSEMAAEHRELLDTIRSGDADAARALRAPSRPGHRRALGLRARGLTGWGA